MAIVPKRSTRPPTNLRDALTEARAVAGGVQTSSKPPPALVARKTIVIADPDSGARSRLRLALEEHYDVIEAKDGMEAIELVTTMPSPPALVVSEVPMPRVDGFSLAKVLRGNVMFRRIPIMFVSLRNGPAEVTQAIALGACQFVPKLTPVSDVAAKIRKIAM